ncbi:MAG TPA: phasin family protein [Pseudomonas sp.]|nr:phasin family protein [Pseudomonas sp.]
MTKAADKQHADAQSVVLQDVKAYARKIWLAGLGAYNKAGQDSAEIFKDLVRAGESIERKGKQLVHQQVDAANSQIDSVKSSVTGVKEKVEVQLDKIEQSFDNRVASALNRLGIPSQQDIAVLSAKLDQLSEVLDQVARNK